MTNTIRVTKAQKFNAIIDVLSNTDFEPTIIPAPLDKDGNKNKDDAVLDAKVLIEFCQNEIETLKRKSTTSSGERKPTARQQENEVFKGQIMEYMALQDEGKTCTEIMRDLNLESNGEPVGNQRIARLMTALKEEGRVVRNLVKGVSYFSMA